MKVFDTDRAFPKNNVTIFRPVSLYMRPLTDKAQQTRDRILEAASMLFYQHGYNATGLEKVINAAGVTKGNFYYYFKSKEALGVETLRWQGAKAAELLGFDRPLGDSTALERLFELIEGIKQLVSSGEADSPIRGCYFGNFSLELSAASEVIRRELVGIFNNLQALFADLISQAQAAGDVSAHIDPASTAAAILSQLEGAIILSKASQDVSDIDAAIAFIRQYLTQ